MNNKNEYNSIKKISEKITNPTMAYDIDEDILNINHSLKCEQKIEDDILDAQEKSPYTKKIIQKKNNALKESLISPLNKINNYDKEKINPSIKLASLKLVICKLHKKEFLKLDSNNFEIVCVKCIEEGKESKLELINNNDSEENNYNCYKHHESKGSFYCDQSKEFICKMCFAEEHRTHKCHLPEIIRQEFEQNVQESINFWSQLNPVLDENINNIKKIYENLKKQKNDLNTIPQNTLKVINNNNTNQIDILMEKTKNKFFGIDNEIHDNYMTFNMLKHKTKQYLEVLKKINEEINNDEKFKTNYDLCFYHNEKSNILNEIFNYINSSLNFINIRLYNSNNKFDENKEKIENSLNLMNKEINNYEKSCISSILTGRENRAIILRRYIHFSHNEIKYFKTSIIGFASNDNIFISGISLCGLYIKRKKNKTNQNNNENKENKQTNQNNNETNNIYSNININNIINEENNKKINIQITISTMSNQVEGEKLFSQKYELGGIKGVEDPAEIIYFEKGVKIIKEKLYLIKIENLSDNNYIDIWTGSVGKLKKKNMQIIRCHNTGIQFLFKLAEGIQTDFDELENGIIEGILYSTNK